MARLIGRLTAQKVAKVTKAGLYGDGGGLALRVGPGGTKHWVLRYQRSGKAHEMGLGSARVLSLAEARARALQQQRLLLDGIDPLAQRARARAKAECHTFAAVAEEFIAAHRDGWRNEVHAAQWRTTLASYAFPRFGEKAVQDVTLEDVLGTLKAIWNEKPETAARLRGRIEKVLDYAKARRWREGENPAAWKGNLAQLLPARAKVAAVEHHPALPWQEIGAFVARLQHRQGIAARAVEWLILTACRSGEGRGACWAEMDRNARTWVIPAHRTKAGKEHRIPLPDQAVAILDAMEELRDGEEELIFPGAKPGEPLSDVALAKIAKGCAPGQTITLHGFRSTFRDWAGETTAYPREVIEMALAHRLGDKAEQAYARGDLFRKRARLMADWATFCSRSAPASDVVPIRDAG